MADTAVVTAVTNNYDHPWGGYTNPEYDYLFFTDGPATRAGWESVTLPSVDLDARRRSKQPKLNPHSLERLREYRYVVWVDGGIEIRSSTFVEEIKSYLNNGLVLSPHFSNTTIAQEARASGAGKYRNEPIDAQIEHYKKKGFPDNLGVFECGVQARDMSILGVQEVGELWQRHNIMWSYQDQISLPYVLWKTGFTPDILPKSFREFNWVEVHAHRSDDY